MRSLALLLVLPMSMATTACGGDGEGSDAGPADAADIDGGAVDATTVDVAVCHTCSDILMGSGEPPLCSGSEALFTALNACTCTGACMGACGMNVCMGGAPDTACTSCLQDTAAGCGNEYAACAMDT